MHTKGSRVSCLLRRATWNDRIQGAREGVNLGKEGQVIVLLKIPWFLYISISCVW